MSIINTNKPNFFGNNGEVLINGFIYIGEPGQNPIPLANQKTVTFTDEAGLSFTATQPLRTNGQGVIQYNGKAIIATVDGDYSQLRQDANQVDIKDGFTPIVSADTSGGGSSDLADYTENGLLLADVKQLVKSPGQTVRSVGKTSTEDGLGSLWLVVSNTGGGGDDVDLIDFDNGLQGIRISNDLAAVKNLSDLDNAETARTNLSVGEYSELLGVSLIGGTVTTGAINIARVGNLVTISSSVGIVNTSTNQYATIAAIPSGYRPPMTVSNVISADNTRIQRMSVLTSGSLYFEYRDYTGSLDLFTSVNGFAISYVV